MERMNLRDVILASPSLNEDLVVYAEKVDGHFLPSSKAVLLELTEEERGMKTNEVANLKCPGFTYCMEMFLIQEMTHDLDSLSEEDVGRRIDRVIYYIEYDA